MSSGWQRDEMRNSREAATVNSLGRQPQERGRTRRGEPWKGGSRDCHPFGVHFALVSAPWGLRPRLLTAVPSGLTGVCLLCMTYRVQQGQRPGKSGDSERGPAQH
jgi:hypothetical protein